jgi:putative CocE/NonD family hydrolase
MPTSSLASKAGLILASVTVTAILATAPAAGGATQTWWQADGATWTQSYIPEGGGVTLHADVLRPAGLPPGTKTPVILSIGPYFNHSGQEGPASTYDPTGQSFTGPSNRFQDFVDGTQLIKQGYTYMMVDLRGYGGSTGCQDWAGPGEQADVKAAVEWAAGQPWSTGRVGMYGKSYDAMTGLMGEAMQPKGLAGIVSQEPVYDTYQYLYTNGVRFSNSVLTPALYDAIAATPGQVNDDPGYNVNSENSLSKPACPASYWASQAADNNHQSAYWRQRNLAAESAGHRIPYFLTQGFLENNTKPEPLAWELFNSLKGPKKAWFGMWDHIRGNDVAEGDNAHPHPWFDAVMNFYNHYVKGQPLSVAPTDKDPAVAVETSDGSWRAEQQWPALDSTGYSTALRPGTYTDGFNSADSEDASPNDTTGAGVWTISPALPYPAHFSGVPTATLDVTSTIPGSDLSVDVYDISPKGNALLLSRYANLLPQGESEFSMKLYGNDWLIPAGDRVGVLVTSANDGWWTPTPTQTPVNVTSGTITLPFLRYLRPADQNLQGYKVPARLGQWTSGNGSITLAPTTVAANSDPKFALPPQENAAPAGFNSGAFGVGSPERSRRH